LASALKDIRIVDLTQHLSGPFCTMLLADMGAEVIKVEPSWGDASRTSAQYPSVEGRNSYFMSVNRNKRSVVLDLKSGRGVEALKRLVKVSDVVVENFRPGVMDRLGLGYEALKGVNPGIIYASISGFGQEGPYVRRPSFDIIAQAMSGWMWLNSREMRGLDSRASLAPSCLAGSPGDTIPGVFCALSILAALIHRRTTGRGQRIDIAQADALMSVSGLGLIRYLYGGGSADERARRPPTQIHGVYEASDGYVAVRVIGDEAIASVAEATGLNIGEVAPSSGALRDWFRQRSREQIVGLLAERVPCAPVVTDEELVRDSNVEAREMIIERQHPAGFTYRTIAAGVRFSETPTRVELLPPELGADTADVLRLVGYGDDEIKVFLAEGAARAPGS
jgi:crotonobetainyl-CoA:carnitine CoA-transferase CaiB-like acyl-CoA transferase